MSIDDAQKSVAALWRADPVAGALSIRIHSVEEHERDGVVVRLAMDAAPEFANGRSLVHGGYLFLLADTALAYCCEAAGRPSVTRSAEIAFLAPAEVGEELVAVGHIRSVMSRTSVCDVRLSTADGRLLAEFRGYAVTARP